MIKNYSLLLAILLFSLTIGNAQILSTESFNLTTFPPAGWSIKVDIAPNNVWVRQTSGTNPTVTPHSGAGLARYRSRSVPAGTKQLLITRPIDYTSRGTSNANLDFWMYRDSLLPANLDSLTIWVNSTDTIDATAVKLGTIVRNRSIAIPDTQVANGWYHYIFAIPASFGGTTTRFIFEGTSETPTAGTGANIFIDDISFDEFPPVCSGVPNVGNIVNPNPLICNGGGAASLSLSAPINGVLGITYSWEASASSTGPWISVGSNSPNLALASVSASTYFRCTADCSFSSLTYTTAVDSIMISSNTPPTVSITPPNAIYCDGSNGVELIAAGATTYNWSPATGLNTTTGDTVLASPSATTTFLVVGSDSIGCKDSATIVITYNAGPAVNIQATPNDSVCKGAQVILNSIPTGSTTGFTYLWSDGKTTRRDTLIIASTATYSVVVTNAQGCSKSDSIQVTALDSAIANFGFTQSGNTFNFQDSTIGASSWTWTFGDGNGSSNQQPVYTYSAPGTFTVTLIASGICNDDTITKVIVVGPLSISNLNTIENINFYPNPVSTSLHIELENRVINKVRIFDLIGQEVASQTNSNPSSHMIVETASLPSGVYITEIITSDHKFPIRWIKE